MSGEDDGLRDAMHEFMQSEEEDDDDVDDEEEEEKEHLFKKRKITRWI